MAFNYRAQPASRTPTINMVYPQSPHGKTSPLVDKVPAEIRLAIFRLVMQTPHGVATRPGSRNNNPTTDTLVNISLFLVNRIISQEAQDTFFEVNTIRVYDDMYRTFLMTGLRNVDIAGPAAETYCGHPKSLRRAISNLASLPKIRSITVMCNGLNRKQSSIREFIADVVPGCELRCFSIGEYHVSHPASTQLKLRFYDFKSTTLLTEAKELVRQHFLHTLVMMNGAHRLNDVTLAACWLKCFEIMRLATKTSARIHLEPSYRAAFLSFGAKMKILDLRVGLPPVLEHVKVEDLKLDEHGLGLVQWAGDLMAESFRTLSAREF